MTDLSLHSASCVSPRLRNESAGLPVPAPRIAVNVRPATMADLPFMDGLQKQHSKQLGYFPTRQFEEYIQTGGVLVAEEKLGVGSWELERSPSRASDPLPTPNSQLPSPLGYLISRDRYLKRDELGVIYQLCVIADDRRKLVGATLLRAAFDRSAYGCRLYCCWCAQDLAANRFWESMGFVPIAFRGGSTKKSRIHIFWQKRIRAGDVTTPWWFPAKTEGGAMREDRLVLPIPPGLHWSDEMPVLQATTAPRLPSLRKKNQTTSPQGKPASIQPVARQFGGPDEEPILPAPVQPTPDEPAPTPKQVREKPKADPKLIAAARELRDRWLEKVNDDPSLLLPAPRYDVARALPGAVDADATVTVIDTRPHHPHHPRPALPPQAA